MPLIVFMVWDSVGIGALPDADLYGDQGAHTLGNIASSVGDLSLPNLERLGLGAITPVTGIDVPDRVFAAYGKMMTASPGKDTMTGHWELMGVTLSSPLATFPRGFPDEMIRDLKQVCGRDVIGTMPASGTEIIKELGPRHLETGELIVYTSADSVIQVAAHEQVIPVDKLHQCCSKIRADIADKYLVGRVIARPFIGSDGKFERTKRRKDFAMPPPGETVLDKARSAGYEVCAIGKVEDIFAHSGISRSVRTGGNDETIAAVCDIAQQQRDGIIFANLIDFDMLYGHRNDVVGYARALERADSQLPQILEAIGDGILFICADHGCDPTHRGTDHTREYVPLIVTGQSFDTRINIGVCQTLADAGATVAEILELDRPPTGTSFARLLPMGNKDG